MRGGEEITVRGARCLATALAGSVLPLLTSCAIVEVSRLSSVHFQITVKGTPTSLYEELEQTFLARASQLCGGRPFEHEWRRSVYTIVGGALGTWMEGLPTSSHPWLVGSVSCL